MFKVLNEHVVHSIDLVLPNLSGKRQMLPIEIFADASEQGDDVAAIALLISHGAPVVSITAVSGNVWVDAAFQNIEKLLKSVSNPAVALYASLNEARILERKRSLSIGGSKRSYLGAFGLETNLNKLSSQLISLPAPEPSDHVGRRDCLLIGPATALLDRIKSSQRYMASINHIYIMGGDRRNFDDGSSKPEFNFWFDPASANELLGLEIPKTLLPIDVVKVADAYFKRAKFRDGFSYQDFKYRFDEQFLICDEILAAIILQPKIVLESSNLPIGVNVDPKFDSGRVHNLSNRENAPRNRLVTKLDIVLLEELLSGRANGCVEKDI